jgi:hypothetical protein
MSSARIRRVSEDVRVPPTTITIRTINDEKVVPLQTEEKVDTRPILGSQLFPELQANILIVARKNSGKTILVQYIIRKCTGPETTIIVFCSTYNKDKAWRAIRKWLKENGIKNANYPSIKEENQDILQILLDKLRKESEEHELDEEEGDEDAFERQFDEKEDRRHEDPDWTDEYRDARGMDFKQHLADAGVDRHFGRIFDDTTSMKDELEFRAPDYIIIFDDIASEIKSQSLINLSKINRHFNTKTITSTQYLKDMRPESIKQMDYVILFQGMEDQLAKIKKDCELAIDLDLLTKIYRDATTIKHNFLYIGVRSEDYRKNFNQQYIIRSPKQK